jgi:flagellar biosynthesis component FlhA
VRKRRPASTQVRVELSDRALASLDSPNALTRRIEPRLIELLEALGVAGDANVEVGPKPSRTSTNRFVTYRCNGTVCRFPDETLRLCDQYARGRLLTADQFGDSHIDPSAFEDPAEVIALACIESVKRHPRVLMSREVAAAVRGTLPGGMPMDDDWLASVLGEVLELGISLARRDAIADVLREAHALPAGEAAELLIAAVRPDVIEIRARPEYLRFITAASARRFGMLASLRQETFNELGVSLPPFRLVADARLNRSAFEFKINDLTALPWIGLEADRRMAVIEPSLLELSDIPAEPGVAPGSAVPCSVIADEDEARVNQLGIPTWDQLDYLYMSFMHVLRAHAQRLVDGRWIAARLDEISESVPRIARAATGTIDRGRLARICRSLLDEQLSVRGLPTILERVLENDEAAGALTNGTPVPADDVGSAIAHVRGGLSNRIQRRYGIGPERQIVAYILAPNIEEAAESLEATPDEALQDRVIGAVRAELDAVSASMIPPVLLTSPSARAHVRRVLADEQSHVGVVAAGELPPWANVQPITRIAL